MSIGLFLLAAVSVAIFFFGTDDRLKGMGLDLKTAFVLNMAIILCAVVPSPKLGDNKEISMGAPLSIAVSLIFLSKCKSVGEKRAAILCLFSVLAVALSCRLAFVQAGGIPEIAIIIISGITSAAVAALTGKTFPSALAGVAGGTAIGGATAEAVLIFTGLTDVSAIGKTALDTLIFGLTFVVLIKAAIARLCRGKSPRLATEKKRRFTEDDFTEYFGDNID